MTSALHLRARTSVSPRVPHESFSIMNTPQNSILSAPLQWRAADDDVFVATSAGEYAGFVGATPRGFEAQGARGQRLGVYITRDLAHTAVSSAASAPIPANTPVPAALAAKAPSTKATAHAAPPRQPRHAKTSRHAQASRLTKTSRHTNASERDADGRPLLPAPLTHLRQRQR